MMWLKLNLGDAGKTFTEFVAILLRIRSQFVKPRLLEKIQILFRFFPLARMAGVENSQPRQPPRRGCLLPFRCSLAGRPHGLRCRWRFQKNANHPPQSRPSTKKPPRPIHPATAHTSQSWFRHRDPALSDRPEPVHRKDRNRESKVIRNGCCFGGSFFMQKKRSP